MNPLQFWRSLADGREVWEKEAVQAVSPQDQGGDLLPEAGVQERVPPPVCRRVVLPCKGVRGQYVSPGWVSGPWGG